MVGLIVFSDLQIRCPAQFEVVGYVWEAIVQLIVQLKVSGFGDSLNVASKRGTIF